MPENQGSASHPDPGSIPAALPQEVDVVVVGAGTAGCVIAARLSEDPGNRVLLEAGGQDDDPAIRVPGRASGLWASDAIYPPGTAAQAAIGGGSVAPMSGRGLGGGSSANAVWWFHGQPQDYTRWGDEGASGWGWETMSGYLCAIETYEGGPSRLRGGDGPMAITSPPHLHPIAPRFLRAAARRGWPVSEDLNGEQPMGPALPQSNIRDGRRHGVVDAYLAPARGQENLTVRNGCRVDRVVVEDGRAIGAQVTVDTATGPASTSVRARRGVMPCAGALRTPQLLMLSGIGPADHRGEHGIAPVRGLPAVGAHLQGHPAVSLLWPFRDPAALRGPSTTTSRRSTRSSTPRWPATCTRSARPARAARASPWPAPGSPCAGWSGSSSRTPRCSPASPAGTRRPRRSPSPSGRPTSSAAATGRSAGKPLPGRVDAEERSAPPEVASAPVTRTWRRRARPSPAPARSPDRSA